MDTHAFGVPALPHGLLEFDVTRAQSARVCNYLLGGKDNFAVDRQAGDALVKAVPRLRFLIAEHRRFVHRVARVLVVEDGIRQFIDIGAGIPLAPNLHEIAQRHAPQARVVYVDDDPLVLAHARALLRSHPAGRIEVAAADLAEPVSVLSHQAVLATLDLGRPIGLILTGVLLADVVDPWSRVEQLREAMPSGSCLVVSHLTANFHPGEVGAAVAVAGGAGLSLVVRTEEAVRRLFGDWELLEPGLVPVSDWRPASPVENPAGACFWAGVARKP
ncbi:SAM-dependent methyltransferase [Actinoplanes couchii]|uniref:S-adenosyl methyltransferase n=1 Tax=Actinoplanes couchii TaxID=403638 RepID=A0ABQ3XTK3_9ACTN|nr:SAM-dependent methyltransferase [Actinoplanes couchii]GID61847.1 hypothetical protein Aco03nite_102510 [Actinoplanes couchii]